MSLANSSFTAAINNDPGYSWLQRNQQELRIIVFNDSLCYNVSVNKTQEYYRKGAKTGNLDR